MWEFDRKIILPFKAIYICVSVFSTCSICKKKNYERLTCLKSNWFLFKLEMVIAINLEKLSEQAIMRI